MNLDSELQSSLVITIVESANLVVFVTDGGRTLKLVFLPNLFAFMLFVFNRMMFS